MYAVIETGGKQYRVSPGQTVEVELLPAEPGATVALDRVLLVSSDGNTLVGTPTVPGGKVVATVAREARGKKIIVFKYHSKKRYRRTRGHRQDHTYLMVTDIQAEGKSLVEDDERRRYERLAERAANRFMQRLLAPAAEVARLLDELAAAQATGDAATAARDEEEIEEVGTSIPDDEVSPAESDASDEPATGKNGKGGGRRTKK
jgi:large subunit ribosomal protein L21